jgi:hypothetical protein
MVSRYRGPAARGRYESELATPQNLNPGAPEGSTRGASALRMERLVGMSSLRRHPGKSTGAVHSSGGSRTPPTYAVADERVGRTGDGCHADRRRSDCSARFGCEWSAKTIAPVRRPVWAGPTPPTAGLFRRRSSANRSLAPATRRCPAQPGALMPRQSWSLEAARRSPYG